MKIFDVRQERVEDAVEEAARAVFAGGTLLYPDETGYVIGCDPYGASAERLYAGARSSEYDLTLCLASAAELLEYVPDNVVATSAVKRLLPDSVTFLVRRSSALECVRDGRDAVALRVPELPFARVLLERCGPLVTRATAYRGGNLDGMPQVDVALDRGEVPERREGSVVDLSS